MDGRRTYQKEIQMESREGIDVTGVCNDLNRASVVKLLIIPGVRAVNFAYL
ncbi:hypothetical protein PMIT1312_00662 [Prochlorococcus marinus str. MIT 1312]|nr:hypothetical protein PMIT1312_00662 [Prochlorococcus marinus str. MIT 1312]